MVEIPLFPLNTVLFPGMPLQLHIFEDRYKQMVNFCMSQDTPFGVALIQQGVEAWGPIAKPYSVGCSAKITSYEPLSEGRYNLWAVGQERFEVVELKYDLPYLVGIVREYPLHVTDPEKVTIQMKSLRPLIERYLRALGEGEEVEKAIQQMPVDPEVFAYLGAVVLQVPSAQKQPFIEAVECFHLLQQLEVTYRREVALVENPVVTHPTQMQGSFSLN